METHAEKRISGLPFQHQFPPLDPVCGVSVPRRAKFDVLRPSVIRKYSFQAFIESFCKRCNVFMRIEP